MCATLSTLDRVNNNSLLKFVGFFLAISDLSCSFVKPILISKHVPM